MKEINKSAIDVYRFLASIFILVGHTAASKEYDRLTSFIEYIYWAFYFGINRISVPFFFMITGYFVYSGISDRNKEKIKFIKKILFLYILLTLIYLPLALQERTIGEVIHDFVFWGSVPVFWYLPAVITGVLFINFLQKYISWNKVGIVIFTLYYLVSLLMILRSEISTINSLVNLYMEYFHTFQGGVFFGSVFLYMGASIKKKINDGEVDYMTRISIFILTVGGVILESYFRQANNIDETVFQFTLPIAAYFLFTLLIKADLNIKSTRDIRQFSNYIYFSHMFFLMLIVNYLDGIEPFTRLLYTLISCLFFSYVLTKVMRNIYERSSYINTRI